MLNSIMIEGMILQKIFFTICPINVIKRKTHIFLRVFLSKLSSS